MNDSIILGIVGIISITCMQIVAIIKPNGADRINQAVSVTGVIVGFSFGVGMS
ncbi:unnamed protein product [marine sediment metagenome]|uniref:Uncharacterized protein n=1 Tax=marine sediment metagenome TaxID=412755 RepID=X1S6Z2_9ZZZZ